MLITAIILVGLAFIVTILYACLVVASGCDDAAGYDFKEDKLDR